MFIHKHKCRKCGEPATHQFTRIEKGDIVDLYLCDEHAAELSPYQSQKPKTLSEILEQLIKPAETLAKGSETATPENLRCEFCNLEFEQYRRTLLLGCSECYRSFRDQIILHLRRFHGDTRHFGRKPGGGPARAPQRGSPPDELSLAHEAAGRVTNDTPHDHDANSAAGFEAQLAALPVETPDGQEDQGEIAATILDLNRDLLHAINHKEYTRAAELRDKIKTLKNTLNATPPNVG